MEAGYKVVEVAPGLGCGGEAVQSAQGILGSRKDCNLYSYFFG